MARRAATPNTAAARDAAPLVGSVYAGRCGARVVLEHASVTKRRRTMKHIRAVAVAVLLAVAAAYIPVRAQGIPRGSIRVAGPPDSAFSGLLTFLKRQGAPV